ncbi:MAG: lipid IV(A) 3-deoxy-D-manno-octulosonic acid transferase [Betaproteobacteria bacterium]
MKAIAHGAYQLAMWCATPLLMAYLWWRGRADPQYRLRWPERFGRLTPASTGAVLVHCGSVGEVLAARPLIESLLADPRWGRPLVTCTTPTGSRQIRKEFGERVDHVYFPLDLPGANRRFLSTLRPRLVILLERELWPNFLHQAQARGVPVVVANARLSAKSAAGYRRWRVLMQPALACLRLVCCEDQATADRFGALGVARQRIRVTGNIKSDLRLAPGLNETIAATRQALGTRAVLTAGSTHAGEDEALIAAFVLHLAQNPDDLLILVPRHPERFDTVARLLQQAGLRFLRHSQGHLPAADTQVLLGDTMGELMRWYGVASACFVGGSLIARGGHNPLEVLHLDKPVIAGPHTHNFAQLYDALASAGALMRVASADAVFAQFAALLQSPAATRQKIENGRAVCQALTGAVARTMAELEPFASWKAMRCAPLASRHGAQTVWVDPECFEAAEPCLFERSWWERQGGCQALDAGRGHIHRVRDARGEYLLRHYYRGGLMARISRDLFLARPPARSRAMAEFTLLAQLRARGLLVPQACAARHVRHGPFYRADILVALIPDARDVAQLLHGIRTLAALEWQALGRAVRALHDEQVWHSDLNCHNLMLDGASKVWIVDFDKCGFRSGDDWKTDNLKRLQRSLRKELRLDPDFGWRESDWPHFMEGYQGARA